AKGNVVNLSDYKGKVLLIEFLQTLFRLYHCIFLAGFEIIAFPCNQFGKEEPGSNDQILDFVCTKFKSDFPIFDKIEVNGASTAPLYKFLKSGNWGIFGDDIQWNFATFLVDRNGKYDVKKLLTAA
ncbi:putative glutathione peroxidase 8, partial [Drosera capensis]